MSSNTIHIHQGRVGKEPELKYGKSGGTAFLTLSVCTSDSWFNKNEDKWVNESNWMDVKFFGKAAERVAETAQKGDEVYLRGHLKLETWDTQNGKGSKLVVIPDLGRVQICPPRPKEEARGDGYRKESPRSDGGRSKQRANTDFDTDSYDDDPDIRF